MKNFFLLFLYILLKSKENKINSSLNETSNINNKKNLVIGAITNYNWEDVEVFFKSYEKAGFSNCDCVMFLGNMNIRTINKIKSCGVIIYEIPKKYIKMNIVNIRWKIYADFINDNKDKYNLVFTADSRDVVFQKDLFKFYEIKKPIFGIALEDGTLTQEVNQDWLIKAYGNELYQTIKNERIICVGTILGSADKFYEFSKVMWEKLSSEWSYRLSVVEQAVSNFIIYHDKMFNEFLVKSENKDGPIMTIGLTDRLNIKLDSENNILNGKGEIAAVIHQYDRKHDITEIMINKFCEKTFYRYFYKNMDYLLNIIFLFCLLFSLILGIIFLYKNKFEKNYAIIYNLNSKNM